MGHLPRNILDPGNLAKEHAHYAFIRTHTYNAVCTRRHGLELVQRLSLSGVYSHVQRVTLRTQLTLNEQFSAYYLLFTISKKHHSCRSTFSGVPLL